ncbi:M16 family metallopeptidase [Thermoactinospora rubra]|uniref:M16 family metallopeptidase n=1 Tax=Thermoactinospora rubra TaxID=1088767 RepID=UPI000A0FB4CE|nr:pitrilysin family protein [Thermoactinospora rubra]
MTVPVRILHRPGAPVTTVSLWLLTGSRDEPEELSGSTHLLEHLLMQAPLPSGERPVDLLEALGGEANAITSRDYLVLYARVPTAEAATALDVLCRAAAAPGLGEEALAAERKVVLEEVRLAASDPFDAVHDLFYATAFPGQPMGRPVGGTARSVAGIGLEDLRERLAGAPLGVVVCGGAGPEAVMPVVESLPEPPGPAGAPHPPGRQAARLHGGRAHLPLNSDSAGIVLGGAAVPYGDRLLPAFEVMVDLVAEASSALLVEEIRNRRGLAYEMWGSVAEYRDVGTWRVFVATAPDQVEEVVEVATTLLARQAARGWSTGEVEVAARRTAGRLLLECEQSLEETLLYGQHHLVAGHPEWSLGEHLRALGQVSAGEVLECLRHAIDPLVVAVAGPG